MEGRGAALEATDTDGGGSGGAAGRSAPGYASALTVRRLLWLFAPLALSNGLMAFAETIVGAVLSRWPQPVISLAAYGAAFNMALLIEGPVLMLLHAGNALVQDRPAYHLVRKFTIGLALSLTVLHGLVAFTPLYDVVFRDWLQLPPLVRDGARPGLMVMLPWTAAIAWRRFLQGVMIRQGHTAAVGIGTVMRLVALVATLAAAAPAVAGGWLSSVTAGCLALSLGVTTEALYTQWASRRAVHALPDRAADAATIDWRRLTAFYWPLAGTSVLLFLSRPVVTAALARGRAAEISLAGWPVLVNTLFLFIDAISMVQQLVIPYGGGSTRQVVRRMAIYLTGAAAAIMALLGLTPVGTFYLQRGIGLTGEVLELVSSSLVLALPYPVGLVMQSWYQGMMVRQRRTGVVTAGSLINLIVLSLVAHVGRLAVPVPGLQLLAAGMTLALLAEGTWLASAHHRRMGTTREVTACARSASRATR